MTPTVRLDLAQAASLIAQAEQDCGCQLLVYGSVATGLDRPDSDLDLLAIGLDAERDEGIASQLSHALGREVSVVQDGYLFDLLAPRIRGEARSVEQLLAGERAPVVPKSPMLYLWGIYEESVKMLGTRGVQELRPIVFPSSLRYIARFLGRLQVLFPTLPREHPELPWRAMRALARISRRGERDYYRRLTRREVEAVRRLARRIVRWDLDLRREDVPAFVAGQRRDWPRRAA